jgi:DNA-binding beta-propeller fold protein YncE
LLTTALLAGCGRKLARRYSGWLFVASAAERGVAVADLSEFRSVTTILLAEVPGQVIRARDKVFVSCPAARLLYELDPIELRVERKISLPARIVTVSVVPESGLIAILTSPPASLHLLDPSTRRVVKRVSLPGEPSGLDLTETMAAVTLQDSVVRVSLASGVVAGVNSIGSRCGAIRFRKNGETILVAAPDTKEIVTLDASTGALLTRLPLSFAPARLCPNDDGGQMFVTGTSGDAIAVVSPYQNEVLETLVAGSTPFGMTVATINGQELLFVTNPASGDLTIFDVYSKGLAASVHVGGNPGEVLVTPGGEYALVINRDSGDVAVIRIRTVLDRSVKTKPLFTLFALAAAPQSAAIIPS